MTTSTASSPPAPGTGALTIGARRLSDLAADVRVQVGRLTTAAADSGWRSTAAETCRSRLVDVGRDLLDAAALLDHAADVLDDHARTAACRAAVLEQAATDLLLGGAGQILGRVLL